ncbi:hypothetical protein PAMA_009183 [Pampus argenteus]
MSGVTDEEEVAMAPEEVQSSLSWSEECCEELWDRVEGVRHKLTRILNPAKLTPYLRQCKVIDEQDEDEVLNSTQYPLRISKAGRLLDILRGQGQRGLQAFMESLEFYHPEQYTHLTGQRPTQRCSLILDEEGPEGLTQFLLLEVRKLREQLRNSRMCERRLSQRCRMAEEERSRAERKAQELRHDKLQLQRLRQDCESASRELGKLKDRHLEQAVKYSRALEEQGKASSRERELLTQVEELRSRLTEAEKETIVSAGNTAPAKRNSLLSNGGHGSSSALPDKPLRCIDVQKAESTGTQMKDSVPTTGIIALMDILQQDRREAAEQRQELCDIITRIQEELQSTEEHRDKLESQCKQLQLKVRTLQLDWETEQKRSMSYFNQIMELEKERDQALRSRDSLQLEYTDCLLDKNRLRKCIAELQADLEQQQRELERERERSQEQMGQSSSCLHCSHLSLCSEDQCYGPCCSLGLDLSPQAKTTQPLLRKAEDNEKEINRLSIFPFPPCMNSINRRFNTEFDLDSWGSDENDNITGEQSEPSLWDSWNSLHSHPFPPDLVNLPAVSTHIPNPSVPSIPPISSSSSPPTSPKHRRASLADDITIVGGNRTGIFVRHVRAGSTAEQCGLKEGSELLEWWTEPSSLKHQSNPEAYSELLSQISSPTFVGADSFYVRVNLNIEPLGDPPSLGVSCDDIIHVTDTRYNGKYHWRCSLVDSHTAKNLQEGTMPNYNSLVQPVKVTTKRPVIFSPSLLSRGLIERLLQPAESGLNFNTCPKEPIQASERQDKRVFSLDSCTPEQALGIRLQSIQDVISQDKHCLLELGLSHVEGLLRQRIYPIVIHIRPKNKKHKKLRKFFPRCGDNSVMEEVCQAEELQLETLPLLYYTLEPNSWSCTEELLVAIRNAIISQQSAVAWVELDRLQ